MLRLRKHIEELEAKIQAARETAPPGAEDLSNGEDLHQVEFTVHAKERKLGGAFDLLADPPMKKLFKDTFKASWNDIFSCIAPLMIDETNENALKTQLNRFITDKNIVRLDKHPQLKGFDVTEVEINDNDYQGIKVQLRALGLICKSQRTRSVKDSGTYWALTPYGDLVMTRLRAIPKTKVKS